MLLPLFTSAQSNDYQSLERMDSLLILNMLKAIEETENISIASMKAYEPNKGYQKVFIWWRIGGIKKDWTRAVITINRSQENVIGYSIDSNRKHPKRLQMGNAEYISNIFKNM